MLAKFVKKMDAKDRKRGAQFVMEEAAEAKQRVKKGKKTPPKSPDVEAEAAPKAKAAKVAGKNGKPAVKKVHVVQNIIDIGQ